MGHKCAKILLYLALLILGYGIKLSLAFHVRDGMRNPHINIFKNTTISWEIICHWLRTTAETQIWNPIFGATQAVLKYDGNFVIQSSRLDIKLKIKFDGVSDEAL